MRLVFLPHAEIAKVACASSRVVAFTCFLWEYQIGFVFYHPKAEMLLVLHPVGDLTWQSSNFDEGNRFAAIFSPEKSND